MRRLKEFAVNSALVVTGLAIGLLFCEFVLFRFIVLPSDVPANAYVHGLVRYAPNQTGVWRIRDEVAAPYAINAQGWNTGAGDYVRERKPGVGRVAVVGDSMVEAMQVPHDRSIAERLAEELSRPDRPVEVYRFAISGAPPTQYLLMIEREVLAYRPDAIVVNLSHNDFEENFKFIQGRYQSSFLKLRVADGKVVEEIPPAPWVPRASDWVRRTAIARCLYYRWQMRVDAIRALFLGSARADEQIHGANVDVQSIVSQIPEITVAMDYVFGRLAAVTRQAGIPLLITLDGVRGSIYQNDRGALLTLNRLTADLAGKHGIPFVDLHPVFQADWDANHRRFEFDADGHWNEHGHAVAARAVANALKQLR